MHKNRLVNNHFLNTYWTTNSNTREVYDNQTRMPPCEYHLVRMLCLSSVAPKLHILQWYQWNVVTWGQRWNHIKTRKPSWRKGNARQRRHSKMAVSRHLGYYRTGNSTIRSADPENPCLKPDIKWIGCTDCEIFAFELYCDLETGVRRHSRSLKVAPLDRPTPKTWY